MKRIVIPILFILALLVIGLYAYNLLIGGESIPEIYLDQDRCAQCGMVISQAEYAALAYRIDTGEWVKFDDIGCLLKYMIENGGTSNFRDIYVADYNTAELIDALDAFYVRASADEVYTPMSSGIVAFSSLDDAEAFSSRYGGEIYTFQELYSWASSNPDMIYQKEMSM